MAKRKLESRFKKHSLGLATSLVSILALTACGSDDDDGNGGDSNKDISTAGCSVNGDKLECPDGSSYDLAALAGKDGENGTAGEDGAEGAEGEEGTAGEDGAPGEMGEPGTSGSQGKSLIRLATVPLGAEVTGATLTEEGTLFFNVQHPDSGNDEADKEGKVYDKGTVGYLAGVNVNELPEDLTSVPVPESDLERETVQVAYGEYQVIGQTGDTFGGSFDNGFGHITDASGANVVVESTVPDFNGYLSTGDGEGYLFTNWENIPGGMSRVKVKTVDGMLVVDETTPSDNIMIDFGTYGTIANCFGSMSPWNTPLTSEEWGNAGDSTQNWNAGSGGSQDSMANYIEYGSNATTTSVFPNTYRYHYIVEITEPTAVTPVAVKHYTMGRYEHENSIVMPDQKTVYLSQDNTNGVFFKFVADTAGDLSKGTLYAAKLTQDAGSSEPSTTGFDIEWLELANSDNATIDTWIADYDGVNYTDYVAGESSYLTDADADAWAAGESTYPSVADGGGQVTAGKPMDDRIVFLESRKAARALGATAEWRKFEGIFINQKRAAEAVEGTDLISGEEVDSAYVYFAISDLDSGMIDDSGDMQLSARVKDCGGVYRMKLGENYDVARIEPVVMGATMRSGVSGSEKCDVDSMAQPDNVIVMDDGRIIVGEDGSQTNNALWLYTPTER